MARRAARSVANPLWAYSLRLYRRPGVAPACIALQDRLGVDVNLLFFCLWMARTGRTLTPGTLRLAAGLARVWTTNVVGPLRGTRRFLKPLELPKLRGAVAQVELAAERAEQDLLFRLAPRASKGRPRDGVERAMTNVARYAVHWRKRPGATDRRELLRIMAAAFPERPSEELRG